MGSRGRSIRLRIYFLVAIPLITMLGLFGYVAYTSVTNWLNLDRAPTLIQETSEPLTNFVNLLQAGAAGRGRLRVPAERGQPQQPTRRGHVYQERRAAGRGGAHLAGDQERARPRRRPRPSTTWLTEVNDMTGLRAQVDGEEADPARPRSLAYTNIIAGQGAVLQAEANSIQDTAPVLQGLGLISAVNTQEDVSEQDAVLAGALVSGSLTAERPGGLQQRRPDG